MMMMMMMMMTMMMMMMMMMTVQPGPFRESQAQQLQAAALISNCWGNRVD